MKFITFTAICCFVSLSSISIQAQAPTFNPFFFGNKPEESKVFTVSLTSIGRYHFDEKWNAGNIYLNNGDSLVAYYMRYDLIRNQLEVIFDNDIKAINGSFIKRFEWFSVERLRPEKFVLRNDFKFDPGNEVTGFLQLLEDGNTKLLKCKRMYAPREATSPTLVNDTDTDIQSIEEYYLVMSGNAVELSGGKRKSLKIFDSKELTKYINDSNLRFNNESDLKEIVKYYNEKIN